MNEKERIEALTGLLHDVIKSQTNNSTKVQNGGTQNNCLYLGFVSDAHSKLYQLEEYFSLLNAIGGKCVVTGDISNGSNHFHGHDNSLNETQNLSDDILATSDVLSRYKDMFIGYVEGNHDQWITEGTSLLLGYLACKIAQVDDIYAKNIEIIKQSVKTEDGKEIPFHFLLVHGEDMPTDVVKALRKALTKACGKNVDAVIFGHTHKMGSANTTVVSKNARGEWYDKHVGAFNPGTLLEASDYADNAGYPANTPFDGTIMRCSVVKNEEGKYKKYIDIENIMDLVSEDHRDMLTHLKKQLATLEKTKFASKDELLERYNHLKEVYLGDQQTIMNLTNYNGHYVVSINGTCDMFSPDVDESIRNKIRENLKMLVKVVEKLSNVSVVLNGDLIYDYNKGYIEKKDYCEAILADIKDLCEILKPIANKIVIINNGKMEESVMKVERDKGNGRISKGKKLTELANEAVQTLQLNTNQAYAECDPIKIQNLRDAAQIRKVNAANQDRLNKEFDLFSARLERDPEVIHELDGYYKEDPKAKDKAKLIKGALAEKLQAQHDILDTTNDEDKKTINRLFPVEDVELRMPNDNLIGNILCKELHISPKDRVNCTIGRPTEFKFKDGDNTKIAVACYTTSLAKYLRELPASLATKKNPPDVVVLNNESTKLAPIQDEFTTPLRISCVDNKGITRVKDAMVINSGGFAYGRCLEVGRIAPNILYKVVDVKPVFRTLIPSDSVNYSGKMQTRQVVEKYNCESVLQNNSVAELIIETTMKQSLKKALTAFDQKNYISQNEDILAKFSEKKVEGPATEEMNTEDDQFGAN